MYAPRPGLPSTTTTVDYNHEPRRDAPAFGQDGLRQDIKQSSIEGCMRGYDDTRPGTATMTMPERPADTCNRRHHDNGTTHPLTTRHTQATHPLHPASPRTTPRLPEGAHSRRWVSRQGIAGDRNSYAKFCLGSASSEPISAECRRNVCIAKIGTDSAGFEVESTDDSPASFEMFRAPHVQHAIQLCGPPGKVEGCCLGGDC